MEERASRQHGAIIVEATMALSFFMFAIYTLLSVVQIAYAQARVAVALDCATKELAQYVHVYFATGLDKKFTGSGGMSSNLCNEVATFLQEIGGELGNVDDELGQYLDDAGNALQGDSLTAIVQDAVGMALAKQMMQKNLVDGPEDTAEAFMRRNHIENMSMLGSKFLEAGEGSTGKDIFMRVSYDIRVVQLFNLNIKFHMSHCAYTQAWANGS